MPTTQVEKALPSEVREQSPHNEPHQTLEIELQTLNKLLSSAGVDLKTLANHPSEALNSLQHHQRVLTQLLRRAHIIGLLYARLASREDSTTPIVTAVKQLWIFLNHINSERSLAEAMKPVPYAKGRPNRIR